MQQSWLDLLLENTQENEAPERYFWWSGIAAISAIARKNVYLERHYYKLYPNIYVALISARSGLRKGIPVFICKSILEETQKVRVISGCNSIQGLIHELSTQRTFENGAVINEAHGILMSDEFESFLTDDPKALTYLTALHNTHEHQLGWRKTLKSSPVEELRAPCLTLLIASNQTLFDSMVKQKDIEGGFIARTIVVYERQKRLINPLVDPPKEKMNRQGLIDGLLEISKAHGEFIWTPEGGDFYKEWYTKLSKMIIDDRTGTVERLGDQVLKVAMLISLSKSVDLFLTQEDLSQAVSKCEFCMPAVNVTGLSGAGNDISEAIGRVMKLLIESEEQTIARHKILTKLHLRGVDSLTLDRVIESLIQSKAIEAPFRRGKDIMYRMTKETYERYIQFKSEEAS